MAIVNEDYYQKYKIILLTEKEIRRNNEVRCRRSASHDIPYCRMNTNSATSTLCGVYDYVNIDFGSASDFALRIAYIFKVNLYWCVTENMGVANLCIVHFMILLWIWNALACGTYILQPHHERRRLSYSSIANIES